MSELVSIKTIGLIGGMSWESTAIYYRLINEETRRRLGGLHSARIVLESLDFSEIDFYQRSDQWTQAAGVLNHSAMKLQNAGANVLALCTNTMHKVYKEVIVGISIPFLHIASPTAEALLKCGHKRVGLLGTRITMEETFYRQELESYGLIVKTPSTEDCEIVHQIIFKELCVGTVSLNSREKLKSIGENLLNSGVTALVLGCTELGMLFGGSMGSETIFDTTELHARALVALALV